MVQVFQLLELPAETQKMETYQALLVTRRALLLHTITNMSDSVTSEQQDNVTQFKQVSGHSVSSEGEGDLCLVQEVSAALTEYEEVCSEAASAGVDLVTKQFTNNWDYIQSCFFALTILTTIGNNQLSRGGYIPPDVTSPCCTAFGCNLSMFHRCRLREFCCRDIRGQIFLFVFRHYRNTVHAVGVGGCWRHFRRNPPTGLGQKQDQTPAPRQEASPRLTGVSLFHIC